MKKFLPLLIVLAVLLGVLALGFGLAVRPLTVEAGEAAPAPEAYARFGFLPVTAGKGERIAATNVPGEHPVALSLFGIPRTARLTVVDTVPPTLRAVPQAVFLGDALAIEDFVSAQDATAVTLRYLTPPDFTAPGKQALRIEAVDLGGNTATVEVALTVHPIAHKLVVEAGISQDDLRAQITAAVGGEVDFGEDLDAFDASKPGEQDVTVILDGEGARLCLDVKDTVAPVAEARTVYLLDGGRAEASDFLGDYTDATAVTAAYAAEPDWSVGTHPVSLTVTDEGGNSVPLTAELVVYAGKAEMTLECADAETMLAALLTGTTGLHPDEETTELLRTPVPGKHTLIYRNTNDDAIRQTVTLTDTVAPTAVAKPHTVFVGDVPDAADFVTDVVDATAVTVSFAEPAPTTEQTGNRAVTVIVCDAGGNKLELSAAMTVIEDTEPPVLSGVGDKVIYTGESVSYRSGVTATDNRDGNVTVKIDSSAVNLRAEGKYPVIYSATDRAGNTVEKTVTFTVKGADTASLNSIADGVLAKILKEGMSERERLRAIYDWVCWNIRYTAYADKSDPVAAAYYGFRNGRGDCFVFYAITRTLLTRAGVENLEIHRNIPNQPHFWNLVKFEGNWYHLDTCPHYAAHPLTCFLLTDAEVKAYSQNHVKNYYSFDASLYPATP